MSSTKNAKAPAGGSGLRHGKMRRYPHVSFQNNQVRFAAEVHLGWKTEDDPCLAKSSGRRGNIAQNHPLPVLNEDDLAVATTRLTGNAYLNWQLKNKIVDIEIKKVDLKR